MENQITSNWIDRYNSGDLSDEERSYFEESLKKNPLLIQELRLDTELERFLADKELLKFMYQISDLSSKSSKKGVKLKKIRFVAAFLGMVAILATLAEFILIFEIEPASFRSHNYNVDHTSGYISDGKQAICLKDTRKKSFPPPEKIGINPGNRLAENAYTVLPEYELLVGSEFRSGLVNIILPEPEISVKEHDKIFFMWESIDNETHSAIALVLTNNKGKKLIEIGNQPLSGSLSLPADTLGRGLFYWKILLQDDIVKMGKVAVY